MKSIQTLAPGGIDALTLVEVPDPVIGPNQVLVKIAAAGVNFMDIGVRRGQFWTEMPFPRTLGVEGAGRVIAVGPEVRHFFPGQRVAWVYAPGSYAERIVVDADALVLVPDEIDDHTAASVMMQGLTASHFATEFYPVQPGDSALVHAAAGGVGQLLSQIIKLRGGTVIGRVSSGDKVAAAKAVGVDQVIVDAGNNFADQVLSLTGGEGVDVVFDGSGPTTFQGSIDSLRRNGTFCWYGPVLGAPLKLELEKLPRSIKMGYAVFLDHVHTPALLRSHAARLFQWISRGEIKVTVGRTYPLGQAAQAHADMESRQSIGKLLLLP